MSSTTRFVSSAGFEFIAGIQFANAWVAWVVLQWAHLYQGGRPKCSFLFLGSRFGGDKHIEALIFWFALMFALCGCGFVGLALLILPGMF